jgi:hypothetical protein
LIFRDAVILWIRSQSESCWLRKLSICKYGRSTEARFESEWNRRHLPSDCADWIEATPEVLNFVPSVSGNILRDSLISVNPQTYVENLRKPTTYGDVLTLHALSSVFKIQWIVLSSNPAAHCIISTTDVYDDKLPIGLLGHHVSHLHYVSLRLTDDMSAIYKSVRGMPQFGKMLVQPLRMLWVRVTHLMCALCSQL